MTGIRAEIGRELQPNTRYFKDREAAFSELLCIFEKITAGQEFTNHLPAAAKKYSQFLLISDRGPFIKAVDDFNLHFLASNLKTNDWVRILSVVMSSGANRYGVRSPGVSEVARLIPLSPFKHWQIVAYVTALTIVSPNELLQSNAHHENYQKTRRLIYEWLNNIGCSVNLLMGAEYFVAVGQSVKYFLEVVKPIDRRE